MQLDNGEHHCIAFMRRTAYTNKILLFFAPRPRTGPSRDPRNR
jgi:hypothetical protein